MKEHIQKIKEFFLKNSCFKAVVGLSGGIDSAVTAKLLSEALGSENVTALIMPEEGISQHTDDAVEFAQQLGINHQVIKINEFIECFKKISWPQNKISEINTKARIRSLLLYNFANSHNALVAGTSNKTELLLGYGTKYGDLACDVLVIGNLYKTEVYDLARQLEIPQKIVSKVPSAELYPEQTDEQELGAPYEKLDRILKTIENKEDLSKFDQVLVNQVLTRIQNTKHKRKMPEVIK